MKKSSRGIPAPVRSPVAASCGGGTENADAFLVGLTVADLFQRLAGGMNDVPCSHEVGD